MNDEKKTEKQNSSIKNIKTENIKLKIIDDNNTELYSEIGEHININNINLEINDIEKEDNKIQTHYINNNFINKSESKIVMSIKIIMKVMNLMLVKLKLKMKMKIIKIMKLQVKIYLLNL